MSRIQLPANAQFSLFRPHPTDENFDEFDIIVNGKKVHTMAVDCGGIKGTSSEELVYAEAHLRGKKWLEQHLI